MIEYFKGQVDSDVDIIISNKMNSFKWQFQIIGLRRFLKNRKIIKTEEILDRIFNVQKYMKACCNNREFVEMMKLKIEERRDLLSSEIDKFNSLKYRARKEKVVCVNKRRVYRYLNGLKNIISRNNRKKSENTMEIIIIREKFKLWTDYLQAKLDELKIPNWERLYENMKIRENTKVSLRRVLKMCSLAVEGVKCLFFNHEKAQDERRTRQFFRYLKWDLEDAKYLCYDSVEQRKRSEEILLKGEDRYIATKLFLISRNIKE
jgi:hypothetical protein